MPITNLAFEGGGVKGIAYAGALAVLEEQQMLPNIQRVAGTSAGAITACLVCLGYTPDQIRQTIMNLDFSTFEDGEGIISKFEKYGMHPAQTFLTWIRAQISAAPLGLSENATFADLQRAGGHELHVFACDLYTQSLSAFNVQQTPNVVIAEAVRASMSIPLFFNAYQFENNNPNNHLYVDGGTVYNYPLTTFDVNGPNPDTLGFRLEDVQQQKQVNAFGYGHWEAYVKALFKVLMYTSHPPKWNAR
jgi:NTE family protein